jgi:hypothetical protein
MMRSRWSKGEEGRGNMNEKKMERINELSRI